MKIFYILFFPVFIALQLQSQVITWAIPNNFPGQEVGLVTDRASNLYQYGYTFFEVPEYNIKHGTTIRKYSPTGTRLMDLQWNAKIFVNQMVYDGAGNFYFVANFMGTINLDGHTATSRGDYDGVLGKMNEWGKVEWITSFGGENSDMANGLTLNTAKTEIIVTGNLDGNAFVGNNSVGKLDHNLFIGVYDLSGNILKQKFFDFDPTRHHDNIGREIVNTENGYFLLGDREGAEWYIYPLPPGPEEGRYMFRLDLDFNIQWSEFVISSGCYYGYSCKNISAANNDVYVSKFCSGKYGGTGHFTRHNGVSGAPSWSLTNNDGSYSDTYAYSNTVYYTGNEDANGCPCPENDPGNGVIKTVDADNSGRMLLKMHRYRFNEITRAPNGMIYVAGYSGGANTSLGSYNFVGQRFLFAMTDPVNPVTDARADLTGVTVYPNPSSGRFEVSAEKPIEDLEILNLSGEVVLRIKPGTTTATISTLQPGYYVLRVKSEGIVKTRKVVVGN